MTVQELRYELQGWPADAVVTFTTPHGEEEVNGVYVTHGVRSKGDVIYSVEEGIPPNAQATGTPITIIQLR